MIRRASPLGASTPDRWALIPQQAHARLSHKLAEAWGRGPFEPLLRRMPDARREFLAAMLHHDDGWSDWWDAPGIDPEEGRPYAFTEMPPADAQRLWSASIDACREEGPLAGWVVAAHFSALQSKRDEDWAEWRPWIEAVDRRRAGWLADWLAASEAHTEAVAERCLAWLQAFDWMSLWLCCRCPADGEAAPDGSAVLAFDDDNETGWPAFAFRPSGADGPVVVDPWPFASEALTLSTEAALVSADRRYASPEELMAAGSDTTLRWRLEPSAAADAS